MAPTAAPAAGGAPTLTPAELFAELDSEDVRRQTAVWQRFEAIEDKKPFVRPAIERLRESRADSGLSDGLRSWAATVLREAGGDTAVDALFAFLAGGGRTARRLGLR